MKKKVQKKSWFQEFLRDLIAFGSLPFYLIVLIRTLINKNITIVTYQLGLSLLLIYIFYLILWKWGFEIHAALVVPLLIFVSTYYMDRDFTILASIISVLLLASLFYLKYDWKKIIVGLIVGVMASGISWWIV